MSWYRDVYLKSEDWLNFRAAMLAVYAKTGICELCQQKSASLDVHHLRYKKLYDVTHKDIRIVCRTCHENIHEMLKHMPDMKHKSPNQQWRIILNSLGPIACTHWEWKRNRLIAEHEGKCPRWLAKIEDPEFFKAKAERHKIKKAAKEAANAKAPIVVHRPKKRKFKKQNRVQVPPIYLSIDSPEVEAQFASILQYIDTKNLTSTT